MANGLMYRHITSIVLYLVDKLTIYSCCYTKASRRRQCWAGNVFTRLERWFSRPQGPHEREWCFSLICYCFVIFVK